MNSKLTGLPLFDWLMRGSGTVLAFPADRRAKLVRETATRVLAEGSSGALAEGFRIVKQDLKAAELDDNETWQHVWAFSEAVEAEITRLGAPRVFCGLPEGETALQGDYPPLPAVFS